MTTPSNSGMKEKELNRLRRRAWLRRNLLTLKDVDTWYDAVFWNALEGLQIQPHEQEGEILTPFHAWLAAQLRKMV